MLEWTDVAPGKPGGYRRQEASGFTVSPVHGQAGWRFMLTRRNPNRIDGKDYLGVFDTAAAARKRAEELT